MTAPTTELLRQPAACHAIEQVTAEVASIPQIAWTSDPAGITSCLNRRWFDVTGEGTTAECGPITDRLHSAYLNSIVVRWYRSVATGEPLDVVCCIRNVAGHYRWMPGRALPSRDEDGGIRERIGAFTDIHEQKLSL